MAPQTSRAWIPLLLALALLQGCTQWQYDLGTPLAEERVPEAGHSPSLTAVLEQLGPPHHLSATPGGYVMAWEHWKVAKTSLGLSLGLLGADILSVDWGNARTNGEFILLAFDNNHRLTASTFSTWNSTAGEGVALQPFVGVSLAGVGDLVRRMPQHNWGAAVLVRQPEALNRESSPESGQAGLQQRGTPRGIGQQSLEMK